MVDSKYFMKHFFHAVAVGICAALMPVSGAFAQGTAFTYQGKLGAAGLPANGGYDFTFALFDAVSAGNQLGSVNTINAVTVSNGLFTVAVDFGGNFPGADRWLEIGVRPASGGGFTTLAPRQKITASPYAITAANLSGGLPAAQLSGTVPAAQAGSFTNHADLVVTGLAAGHTMIFNGTVWTNSLPPAAGPSPSNNIPVVLSFSGTNVAVDASAGTHFRLNVTNNFLLLNPTGAVDAQRLLFEIVQDAAGGHTMTLGSAFKLGLDIPMVNLTTNGYRRDFMTCVFSGTNFYVVGFVKGY